VSRSASLIGRLVAIGHASTAALTFALLASCGMLPPPSLVTRTRIVGAELSVAGDPGRAWPLPGETVTLTYFVLQKNPDEAISAGLTACPAGPSIGGMRFCAGAPFAVVPPAPAEVGPLSFEMTLPPASVLGEADELVVLLATCAGGGMPVFDMATQTARCDGDMPGRAELSTFVIQVADPDAVELANRHPLISDETVSIELPMRDPMVWDAPTAIAPEVDCAAMTGTASFPRIETTPTDGRTLTLAFTSSAIDRETYIRIDPLDGPIETREPLEFSHFATIGSFERNQSTLDGTSTDDRVARVEWTTPAAMDIPAGGATLHMWWVARDDRGGFALMQRDACVVVGAE
jgi:hypothetical protein